MAAPARKRRPAVTVAETSTELSSVPNVQVMPPPKLVEAPAPSTPVPLPTPVAREEKPDTHQKALQINLDPSKYGAFAEIGAGQEVARWFFRVGGAAGTIAKSMSAYDMTVSDAIYGPCDRYVARSRLQSMLHHEFHLLRERLHQTRGATTKFFAFANTVKARGYKSTDDSHGWLGVRFQTHPGAEPSDITIHVRMLDSENLKQQEVLGIIGVNLIHAALYHHADPDFLIQSLLDNLTPARIEVDMAKLTGPAFAEVDNRLIALLLVEKGLAKSAMFTANGEVVEAGEVLYRRPILVERGSFRPLTNTTVDMLRCALGHFIQEPQVEAEKDKVVVLLEMTMKNLTTGDGIDHRDFLNRVDLLGTLGKTVLISKYGEYHRLAAYLFRYTKKMIGIVMGVPSVKELFEEKYYADLDGGILESFGRLFKNSLKIYAYPVRDPVTGSVISAGGLRVDSHLRHLHAYLVENHYIQSIRDYDERCLPIFSRDLLAKIQGGDPGWEPMVPPQVARLIKERGMFGYRA